MIPRPGAHGGDGARVAAGLGVDPAAVLDLSLSLNPVAPDVGELLVKHVDAARRYPDPTVATAALAAALDVDTDRVLLTNGGAEAIALVGRRFGGSPVAEPDFGLYPRDSDGPRWRSNPHNPTGQLAAADARADVWDEAFYPLATGRWTRGDAECGAVVVGSLTKVFACPGLRAGYVLADSATIEELSRLQPEWSVNGVAASALPALLATADLAGWCAEITELRRRLVIALRSHGLSPLRSDANYVLVPDAAGLRDRLARQRVVVRDCSSFGLPDHVRVAVPDTAGLARLQEALEAEPIGEGSNEDSAVFRRRRSRSEAFEVRRPNLSAQPRLRGGVMVCGTTSDAGKSVVVAAICRMLHRRGVRVAPFKAQNMALNSFVTADGAEIGRAQAMQAEAAGVAPEAAMNPILLKPTGERTSQVVVMGRPLGHFDAVAYHALKPELFATVSDALFDLRSRYDVVVLEGAGSPAEINLLDHDIVNLRVAAAAGVPAIVVGDIDRGGVFAALYGTVALLPDDLRRQVRGFVLNKFRGDSALLEPGLAELEQRTAVPTLGVLPWIDGVALDAEDSLALDGPRPSAGPHAQAGASGDHLDVAVVRFPRIANFTDLDPLALEPGVSVRYVTDGRSLGDPDLLVLPGTKATVADLEWLRGRGIDHALQRATERGTIALGICGGYQMLGASISDDVESGRGVVPGLGHLEVTTTFGVDKVTRQRRGVAMGQRVSGYEIHHGRSERAAGTDGWMHLDDVHGVESEGAVDRRTASFLGTTLHGLFEEDGFRGAFLCEIGRRRGKTFVPAGVSFHAARASQLDRLADLLEANLDLAALDALIKEGAP